MSVQLFNLFLQINSFISVGQIYLTWHLYIIATCGKRECLATKRGYHHNREDAKKKKRETLILSSVSLKGSKPA